eukprot:1159064-Pelagomonas_calceolata.AAC.2
MDASSQICGCIHREYVWGELIHQHSAIPVGPEECPIERCFALKNIMDIRKYWKVWPSPTSYYNALHWGQIFNEPEPKFMAFNYGPEYDLTKVKAPVVLFTAGRDVLATPKDMSLVRERLASGGSLAGVHESESFGHMDYICWDVLARPTDMSLISQRLASRVSAWQACTKLRVEASDACTKLRI